MAVLLAFLVAGGVLPATAGAASPPAPPRAAASIPPGPIEPAPPGTENAAEAPVIPGYYEVTDTGAVSAFGAGNFGGLSGTSLPFPVAGITADPAGGGYWLFTSDGGVAAYGSAKYLGSMSGIPLNKPIVGMAATPDGDGYWLVASDGGIFSFGDARFFGSTGNIRLNKPIVGMASTANGDGYWLVASDGGIFAFGDAGFHGSTGNIRLNKPVVGMAPTPGGQGYWLVASDGGIFAFGRNTFYGSTGDIKLNSPIVSMTATPDGHGYWMVAGDGGIFAFGDAPFLGSSGGNSPEPVVGMSATSFGSPFSPADVGHDISFPQCSGSDSANLPAAGSSVSIVGVNDGASPEDAPSLNEPDFNPCFATEAHWAGKNLSVYVNMDNLLKPQPSAARAGQLGAADIAADVKFVRAEGFDPQVWWLDIEAPCGFSTVLWQCGATGQAINRDMIVGAVNELHALGLTAGIYSTFLQWPDIAGSGATIPGIPIWIAGAADQEEMVNFCTEASHSFADGTPYLVQWGGSSNGTAFDEDYACSP